MTQAGRDLVMTRLYEEYAATPALAKVAGGRQPVRGLGRLDSPLMVVGEAPGEQEELRGYPFAGPAGRMLQDLFREAGVPWGLCYVTNVLPWRPPGNRTPYPFEVQSSYARLAAEADLVDPVVVVAAGATAWKGLTRDDMGPFATARLKWHELNGRRLLAVPHPSYLLHLRGDAERGAWRQAVVGALATVRQRTAA